VLNIGHVVTARGSASRPFVPRSCYRDLRHCTHLTDAFQMLALPSSMFPDPPAEPNFGKCRYCEIKRVNA
jgi:hypothetical protein